MKEIKQAVGMALALAVALLIARCASPIAGNTSETGNSKIASLLYNPGGTPAANAKVRFCPHDYNPRPDSGSGTVDSTTTDANGNYAVTLPAGTYTLTASSDSGMAYQDAITAIKGDTVRPHPDTLRPAGTIHGTVRLEEGGDLTTIFILFMGTRTFTMPDSFGNFTSDLMAGGRYRVKILTTTPDYVPLDDTLKVTAGQNDTLPDTIVLKYNGIPVPKNVRIAYDTLKQIVTLIWDSANASLVSSYNVYRKNVDSNTVPIRINASPVTATIYSDSTGVQDMRYEYRVASVNSGAMEGGKSAGVITIITSAFTISDTLFKISGILGSFDMDKEGNLYLINITSGNVQIFGVSGTLNSEWAIGGGFNYPDYYYANNIAVSPLKEIFVWNNNLDRVQRFDSSGLLLSQTPNMVSVAEGTCLCGDTIFVADFNPREIYAFNLNGDSLFSISNNWSINDNLRSICSDTSGNIYVYGEFGDSYNRDSKIECFTKEGLFVREIIPKVAPYSLGTGTIVLLNNQIIVATFSTAYCFDLQGNLIYKFTPHLSFNYSIRKVSRHPDGSLIIGLKEGYFLQCNKR
jgi:hypothetical protein